MNKHKIIFWVTTGLIGLMMLFSGSQYFMNPKMIESFTHIGFPNFFRIELGTAKIIGALALLIPQIPSRIKEWAYAGFGIVLISASIAHASIGDAIPMIITPLVFLGLLVISYIYWHKTKLQ